MLRRFGLLAVTSLCFANYALAQQRVDEHRDALPEGVLHRLGTTRWRHGTGIYFVAIMPDTKAVLTASKDHVIRLWDRETGKQIRRFESSSVRKAFQPHPFKFYRGFDASDTGWSHATVSPDGKTLAAALPNGVIQIWEVKTGKEIRQFKGPAALVHSIRLSPSAKALAVRSMMQAVTLYDLQTGKEHRIEHDDLKDGKVMPGANAGMAFSPDGTILANGKTGSDQGNLNTFVQLVLVKTGAEIRRFDTGMKVPAAIAFAPDGKLFAYSAGDIIHLRETGRGNEIRQIKTPAPVTALIFFADGKRMVGKSLDQQIRVWNAESGNRVHQWGDKADFPKQLLEHASEDADLALSADGKVVAWGDGQSVRMWDTVAGKDLAPAVGHRAAVTGIRVNSDGKTLASFAEDDTLRRWDIRSGKQLDSRRVPAGTTIVAFAPDGQTAALANSDGTIRLVELATGKEQRQFPGHVHPNPDRFNETVDLAFSPDGKLLASQGSHDCLIRIFDVKRGGELRQIRFGDPATGVGFRPPFYVWGGMGLAFSTDGQTVAACETHTPGRDGPKPLHTAKLRQWDLTTGKELRPFALAAMRLITEIAYSPDGRLLAAMHEDQTISLYETVTGRERTLLGTPRPSQLVNAWIFQRRYESAPTRTLVFSPDGRRLLSRSPLDVVRVWDVHAGEEMGQLKGHEGPVLVAAFTRDNKRIVTGGNDTTILIWEAQRLKRKPIPFVALEPKDIESSWEDLLEVDSAKAFKSMQKLVSAANQSVPMLRERVKPAKVDAKRIERLIADLDSSDFRTRTNAAKELAEIGEPALHALKNAHRAAISPEARRRIEPLLEKLTPIALGAAEVRLVRGIEILEWVGSVEARQILQALAKGAPGALTTFRAKAALDRLGVGGGP